jgi:hypothetical protein
VATAFWQTHRADVRDSARLVRRELSDAEGALEYAASLGEDAAAAADLRASIDQAMLRDHMWRRHWPTLADSLTRGEWHALTTAYANVGYVLRASAKSDEALVQAAQAACEPVSRGYRILRGIHAL